MAGENTTVNATPVTYTTDSGEVKYELKPGENSVLDASDLTKVAEYAVSHKLTEEQAIGVLTHREEAAAGFKTRLEASTKAPDKYELKLGEQSILDQGDLDKIAEFAKANKLTQAQAELLVQQREDAAVGLKTRQVAQLEAAVTKWAEDVKTDPEIGGDKMVATLKNTKRVMDRFAPEGSQFRKLLKESGYGNHPEFVRFVNAIGASMSEDGDIGNGRGNEPEKTLAEKMYGTQTAT